MSATPITIPPLLTAIIGHLAAAVPARARTTFTELLVGAATTRGGHVTDAILAAGLTRSWTTYYWFIEYGRWAWLAGAAGGPDGAVRTRGLVRCDRRHGGRADLGAAR